MNYQILDLQARELLKKFGAGSHKPGSGSGAAIQGMIAACFVRTVAQLTNERQKQHAKHEEFFAYIEEIDSILLPNLEILCQKDSEGIDKLTG